MQERSLQVLSNDAYNRRGVIDELEANSSEIQHLKQALAQLQHSLESTRAGSTLSIDAAVAPLQAQMKNERRTMMNEINALREIVEKQLSHSMEKQMQQISHTIQRAVKEEAAITEKKCIDVFSEKNKNDEKYIIKIITEIITKATTEIESNLKKEIDIKVGQAFIGKRDQDKAMINKQVIEIVRPDLESIKNVLKQMSVKQAQLVSKKRTDLLIESLRQDMSSLEERLISTVSERENAQQELSESLSRQQLQTMENELGNVVNSLSQQFITKNVVEAIVEDRSDSQYDRCIKVMNEMDGNIQSRLEDFSSQLQCTVEANDDKVKSLISECKSQVMNYVSAQFQAFATKEEVDVIANQQEEVSEHIAAGVEVVEDLESRLNVIEEDFGVKMNEMLDVVESCDERVTSLLLEVGNGDDKVLEDVAENQEMSVDKPENVKHEKELAVSVNHKTSSILPIIESFANDKNDIIRSEANDIALVSTPKTSDKVNRELILSPDSPGFTSFIQFLNDDGYETSSDNDVASQADSSSSSSLNTPD